MEAQSIGSSPRSIAVRTVAMQPTTIGAPGQAVMSAEGPLGFAVQKLQPLTSSRVQQRRRLLEAVSCFEQQNMYVVYAGEGTDQQLFWVQENSSCIQRNCLPPDCAPWTLSFHDLQQPVPDGQSGKHNPEFLRIERPCSFTCLCFNRPEATITEVPSGRVLGSLRDPWACCNFTYELKDATAKLAHFAAALETRSPSPSAIRAMVTKLHKFK